MNDVKIDIKNRTITFGDFIKFYDVPKYVIDYINKLQSNWNSLREWLEEEIDTTEGYFKVVLDKMNELEGGEDEKI